MSSIQEQLTIIKLENFNLKEFLKKSGKNINIFELECNKEISRSQSPEQRGEKIVLNKKVYTMNTFSKSQEHFDDKDNKFNSNHAMGNQSSKIRMVRNNSTITEKINANKSNQSILSTLNLKNTNSTSPRLNNFISSIATSSSTNVTVTLAEMVYSFVKQMSTLQEAITNKIANTTELKKKFEINKRNLNDYANDILMKHQLNTSYKSREVIVKSVVSSITNDINTTSNIIKIESTLDSGNVEPTYTIINIPLSSPKDNSHYIINEIRAENQDTNLNVNQVLESKEINSKISKMNITSLNDQNNEQFDKEKLLLKKEIEKMTEKVNLLSYEKSNYKAKVQIKNENDSSKHSL